MLSVDEFATEGMVPEDLGHKGSIALLEEVRGTSDDIRLCEEEIHIPSRVAAIERPDI